jgi:hypothetical protein
MTTRLRPRTFLLTIGIALLFGACSSASAPSTTTAPNGAATSAADTAGTAPSQEASSPVSASPATAASSSVDPCSLLTQSEVDASAGQPLGHGAQVGALGDCQWSSSDFTASVELDVGDWSAIKAKSAETGQTLTPVPGVGDEALTLNRAGNAAQLYVRKGNIGFVLLLGGGQYIDTLPDLGLAQEKVLAAAVLSRL